jgi:hypothetical protein
MDMAKFGLFVTKHTYVHGHRTTYDLDEVLAKEFEKRKGEETFPGEEGDIFRIQDLRFTILKKNRDGLTVSWLHCAYILDACLRGNQHSRIEFNYRCIKEHQGRRSIALDE